MKEEYISISEFAKRAGISVQAVYKRVERDLKPWLKVENGKKTLNIRALEKFKGGKDSTKDSTVSTKISTEVETIKLLQKTVDLLEKELIEKDRQIEHFHLQVSELEAENRRLSEKLLSLSEKVGDTLQSISQAQLADKLIEGKALAEKNADQNEGKRHWWRFGGRKSGDT